MRDLSLKERLQPSLLDRLTDAEPDVAVESREQRVLSIRRLRDCVLRDLAWLLNTSQLAAVADLTPYPEVRRSVLNYGIADLAGKLASSVDTLTLERVVRQSVWDFEPRILRHTLKVQVLLDQGQMSRNALAFIIEGELWAQPVPLRLYLKTEVDLETGQVAISEAA